MSDLKPEIEFSELLHAERRRTGITQKQCAEILGVSRRTINLWDNGEMIPHLLMQEGAMARLAKLPTKRREGSSKFTPVKVPTSPQTKKWEESVVVKPVLHPIQQFVKDVEENAPPSPNKKAAKLWPLGGPGPASERVITPETLEEPLRSQQPLKASLVNWSTVDWRRPPFQIAQDLGIPLSTVLKNKPNRP